MVYDFVTTKPELNEETLAHYGIKGMKWKNRSVANATTDLIVSARKNKRVKDSINSKKAKDAYESRKSSIKLARGNAHRKYGKKTLGLIGYKKTMKEPLESGNVLKTIYLRGNNAYETTPKIHIPSKKKKSK